MAHQSLYRKYRSQSFGELVGQAHVVRSLQNALKSGKHVHAYLFTGPRGTGKTSTARLLAKALCCEKGPAAEPCNECPICVGITNGSCMDIMEIDAASESGVEDVRENIVQVAAYVPAEARYKVIIIDEVHDLSSKAFDALLKTIEEPPAHLIFVLATTEYHKVPPTIRSRCQKFEFHRGSIQDLASCLETVAKAEKIDIEPAAVSAIARMADGGYRDALNLLEQAALTSEGKVTLAHVYDQLGLIDEEAVDQLLLAIRGAEYARIMELVTEFGRLGRDPRAVLESALFRLADLTRASLEIGDVRPGEAAREAALHETAARMGSDAILALRGMLSQAHIEIRDVSLPRIWFESELIRIARELNGEGRRAIVDAGADKSEGPRSKVESPVNRSHPRSRPTETHPAAGNGAAVAAVESSAEKPTNGEGPAHAPRSQSEDDTADPELRLAREVWGKVTAAIQQSAKGTAVAHKLMSTRISAFSKGKITVEFARKMDRDWVVDGDKAPARLNWLRGLVHQSGGQGWELEYTVASKAPRPAENPTVELPAEGQKLVELAKEVFPGG